MEYVRGITLDELVVERGAMPAAIFGPLFVRLCEVAHTMHELGIIHRDIKGSNVMVIERAGQLLPKLLDFGIAKAGDGEVSPGVEDDDLTGHGVTLGSPAYMAPRAMGSPARGRRPRGCLRARRARVSLPVRGPAVPARRAGEARRGARDAGAAAAPRQRAPRRCARW